MFDYDWSRFTKRINIKAPAVTIYNAWATRAGIESWFVRFSEYKTAAGEIMDEQVQVQQGDIYAWRWHGYPDSTIEYGKILAANGTDYFKFSFGKAGDVSVKLTTEEGDSIVELTQENIPVDEAGKVNFYIGCGEGWTFYLASLKSILEGGIDLRNKNENIHKLVNS